jgi:hypothetical protein
MAYKTTFNSKRAIIDIEATMAHWKTGKEKLMKDCLEVKEIPINLYTGVKATY